MKISNTKTWNRQIGNMLMWKMKTGKLAEQLGRTALPNRRMRHELVGAHGVDSEGRPAVGDCRQTFFQEVRELRYGTYVDFAREEFWNQFGLFQIYSGDPLWPVFAEKMA